jgi:hypothetical protein
MINCCLVCKQISTQFGYHSSEEIMLILSSSFHMGISNHNIQCTMNSTKTDLQQILNVLKNSRIIVGGL